jgi:flagellar hook-associated protein 2
MGLSVGGLGSGLDIDGMITKLMAIESQPLTALSSKEAKAQAKTAAWDTVKSAVAAFQTATRTLQTATAFNQAKGTSSDSAVASITTTSGSKVGSVSLEVTQLAKTGKATLVGTYTSGQVINSGAAQTLTVQFGTQTGAVGTVGSFTADGTNPAKTITIRAGATLEQAIADINSTNAGITARTVSTPAGLKVVVESTFAGAKSDFKITTPLFPAGGAFGYVPDTPSAVGNDLVHGQDAKYTIDDVPITSKTNTITDTLTGSTITLNSASTAGKKTTVSVTQDSEGVKTQVEAFVKAYNEMNTTLRSLSAYGTSAGKGLAPVGGGVLSGDATLRAIQIDVRNMFNQAIPGAPKGYSSMVDVGVTFAKDGTLELNSTKLSSALTQNAEGVRQLFMGRAQFSQSGLTALNSNSLTKSGSYGIDITSVPTKAKLTGGVLAGGFPAAAGTLKLNIDGTIVTANMGAGYSTPGFLATGMQTAINTQLPAARQVTVAYNAGLNKFEITSGKTGSISKVEVLAGTSANYQTNYGFTIGSVATGTSLAGKVGGVAALGDDDNMTLIGASGSGAAGLKFRVDTTTVGTHSTVSFAQGFAYNLDNQLSTVLGTKGSISSRKDSITTEIKQLNDQYSRISDKLVRTEASLRKQFNAMDSTVSKYNQLSTYLTQQLKALTSSSN